MSEVISSAVLSADGRYRYLLRREWDASATGLTFVMLNPSTADAETDDPTIRRCMGFARREGFGGINVLNLFAYRATDPRELRRAIDPIGPDNDVALATAFEYVRGCVIAAWGAHVDPERVRKVRKLAGSLQFHSLGTTKDGNPRHPLYVRSDQAFERWPAVRQLAAA